MPEALSAAAHTGELRCRGAVHARPGRGPAARPATRSDSCGSTVAQLPETLDGPASTPAVSRHLLAFADGLDRYADRGHGLGHPGQCLRRATWRRPVRTSRPAAAHRGPGPDPCRWPTRTPPPGGRYAVPLANAVGDKNQLNERTVTGYTGYHENTDAATAGEDPGRPAPAGPGGADPCRPGDPNGPTGDMVPATGPAGAADFARRTPAQMASMLPQMIPTVLGAAGGLVGGLIGAVTKVARGRMQAGTQAVGAATQSLSGLSAAEDRPAWIPARGVPGDPGCRRPRRSRRRGGGGGDAPTTPAGGDGAPALAVAPSTGAPPDPAIAPVGATGTPRPATPAWAGCADGACRWARWAAWGVTAAARAAATILAGSARWSPATSRTPRMSPGGWIPIGCRWRRPPPGNAIPILLGMIPRRVRPNLSCAACGHAHLRSPSEHAVTCRIRW